jgi:excisionase family DNA binding protein
MHPFLLSVADACRALSVSRSTFYELVAAGRIKPKKLGRKTLISADDIAAFVASLPIATGKGGGA